MVKPTDQEFKETAQRVGQLMFENRHQLRRRARGILVDDTWCAETYHQAWCYAWYEIEPSFGLLGRDDYFWGEVEDYIPESMSKKRTARGYARAFESALRDFYVGRCS